MKLRDLQWFMVAFVFTPFQWRLEWGWCSDSSDTGLGFRVGPLQVTVLW